jgi:hypothetical protein
MTIEIQRPELEALIRERMKSGAFQNVEDVLMQALKASPAPDEKDMRGDRTRDRLRWGLNWSKRCRLRRSRRSGWNPDACVCLYVTLGSDGVVARYEYSLGTAAAQA